MAHSRDFIPPSQSSSSHNIDPSPSVMARVMAIAPTTSRAMSSIKPFLLGFAVAFVLFGIGSLSSIYALCSNYIPAHGHLPRNVNGDRIASNHQTSVCKSSDTIVAKLETEKVGGLGRNKGHLMWREVLPFLSYSFPRRKKTAQQDRTKDNAVTCNDESLLQTAFDPRGCLCNLLWEPFSHQRKLENTFIEDDIEERHQQHKSTEQFPMAFTPEMLDLSPQQVNLIEQFGNHIFEKVLDFEQRSSLVPWGGSSSAVEGLSYDWYDLKKTHRGPSTPLDHIDGGNLFSSYLRIMKWPVSLAETIFPFKLCKEKKKNEGKVCDTSVAIQHTLEFRERYKPWLVTPSIKKANTNGLVFIHGFSPPYAENEGGGHAVVWLRLALKVQTSDENDRIFFVRSMIREFDRAVAASLLRSGGRVGKFNAVVDGKDFTWSSMPSLSAVKGLVSILQDHFADRLGVVILVNVGSICELLLKIFLPLITEEVRNKIVMLPRDPKERLEALKAVLGPKSNIPIGLGGTDDFDFNLDEYYSDDIVVRDEEALEYLTTMPYHA